MKLKRTAAAGAAALLTAAALSGCIGTAETGRQEPGAGSPETLPARETVTMMHVDAGKPEFEAYIRQAEQKLGITIRVTAPPANPDSRHAKISTMLAAGDKSVDIFSINDEMLSEYKGSGYLEPLSGRVVTEEIMAQYPEDYLHSMLLQDGEIYSVPYMMDVMALWVNEQYLEEAGLENVDTMEDFKRFLMHDWGEGRYAYGGAWDKTYAYNEIGEFISLFGGDYYDWGNPATREAVRFMKEMVAQGSVPMDSLVSQYEQVNQKLLDGKVGMTMEYSGFMNELTGAGRYGADEVHIARLPGSGAAYVAAWQYALNRASEHKEAAMRFLSYAAGREGSIDYAAGMNRLPVREDVIGEAELDIPGIAELRQYFAGVRPAARPMPENSMEYISRIGGLFQEYVTGRMELEEYCGEMQKLVDTARRPSSDP